MILNKAYFDVGLDLTIHTKNHKNLDTVVLNQIYGLKWDIFLIGWRVETKKSHRYWMKHREINLINSLLATRNNILGFSGPSSWSHFGNKSFLDSSGRLSLCLLFAKMAHLGSIWSHLGTHFGSHFGTKSAQEEPRWAQEGHQEPQSTENLQHQKP